MDSSDAIEIRDKSLQPDPGIDQILQEFPVVDTDISYQDFFKNFILRNLPCLIKADSAIRSWPSFTDWVTPGLIICCLVWVVSIGLFWCIFAQRCIIAQRERVKLKSCPKTCSFPSPLEPFWLTMTSLTESFNLWKYLKGTKSAVRIF